MTLFWPLGNGSMNKQTYTQSTRGVFKKVFKGVVEDSSYGHGEAIDEAAFPAYAHSNIFIDRLFWGRLSHVERYILSQIEGKTDAVRILDFGCGSGVMSYILGESRCEMAMTDLDPVPYRYIQERIPFPSSVEWVDGSELQSGKYAQSFDMIIALDVLEHVEDLEGVIKQFQSLLKNSGNLIVSGPTENILYQIGRRVAGGRFTGHYHRTTIDDIRDVCEQSMTIRDICTLYSIFPLFRVFSGVFKR